MGTSDKLKLFRNYIFRNFQGKVNDISYSEIVLIMDSFSNIINNYTNGMYNDSIKEISVKLISLVFIMKYKGKYGSNDIETEFLKSVYMSTVQEYIDLEFNNNHYTKQTNQLFDIIWELDLNNMGNIPFDYHQFCQNPNGALNDFMFNLFKDNFQNDRIISFRDKDKWNNLLYKAINRLLNTDKRFKSLYDTTSPLPIKNCITSLDNRMKHKTFIMHLMNQELFNEKNITYEKAYCSLPFEVELKIPTKKYIFNETVKNKAIDILEVGAQSYNKVELNNENLFLFKCDKEDIIIEYMSNIHNELILIHGNPGQGKSILTTKISCELSRRGELIFWVSLSHIKFDKLSDIKQAIIELLSKQNDYFFHLIKDTSNIYLDKIEEIRDAVFIFDGLDEIREDYTFEKARLLIDYIYKDISNDFRVIISMRSNLFKLIEKSRVATIIKLCDLEKIYQEKILVKYKEIFKIDDVCIEDIEKTDVDFLKTPLLIFLFVWLAHYGVNIKNIKSRSQLYELILQVVYEKNYDKQSKYNKTYDYREFLQILQIIGFCSFLNKMRDIPISLCSEYAKYIGVGSLFDEWIGDSSDKNKGIDYLITQFFFEKGKDSSIYFHHYTFSEYLWCKELITRMVDLKDESKFDYLHLVELPTKIFKYHNICDKYNGADDYPLFDSIIDELPNSNRKKFNDNCFKLYLYCLKGDNKLIEVDSILFINNKPILNSLYNCSFNEIKKNLHKYNIRYYENIMNLILYKSEKLISKQDISLDSKQEITALIFFNLINLNCISKSAVFYNLDIKGNVKLISNINGNYPEFYYFNSFIGKILDINLECSKDIKILASDFNNGQIHFKAKTIRIIKSGFIDISLIIEAEELYMEDIRFKSCYLNLMISKEVNIKKTVFEDCKVNRSNMQREIKKFVKRNDFLDIE